MTGCHCGVPRRPRMCRGRTARAARGTSSGRAGAGPRTTRRHEYSVGRVHPPQRRAEDDAAEQQLLGDGATHTISTNSTMRDQLAESWSCWPISWLPWLPLLQRWLIGSSRMPTARLPPTPTLNHHQSARRTVRPRSRTRPVAFAPHQQEDQPEHQRVLDDRRDRGVDCVEVSPGAGGSDRRGVSTTSMAPATLAPRVPTTSTHTASPNPHRTGRRVALGGRGGGDHGDAPGTAAIPFLLFASLTGRLAFLALAAQGLARGRSAGQRLYRRSQIQSDHRNNSSGRGVQPSRTRSEWVVAWPDAWATPVGRRVETAPLEPVPRRSVDEPQSPRRLAAPGAAEPAPATLDAAAQFRWRGRERRHPSEPLDALGGGGRHHARLHHHLLEWPARLEHQPHEAELQRPAVGDQERQHQAADLQHRQRQHHRGLRQSGPEQPRVLGHGPGPEFRRRHACAAAPEERRPQVHEVGLERVGQPAVVRAPHPVDHRPVRLDEPKSPGRYGRGDEHRAQPGEGVHHRKAQDDLRRRRRLRTGERGDQGGRRLPEAARQVP